MPDLTQEYLDALAKGGVHEFYEKSKKHAKDMGVHVEGETPDALLERNRPNEDPDIRKYRIESYEPPTLSLSEKVVNTINKVFNPRLHSLDFPDMSRDETLEKYLFEDYPFYRSIMNFITETFTTKCFSDPNALMMILPESFEIPDTEFFEPIPFIFPSESVVEYIDKELYVIKKSDKLLKVYTRNTVEVWQKQKGGANGKEHWVQIFLYEHNFGFIPGIRLGGIISGKMPPYYFESFIRGVLPHWNQVVNMTSDLHAAYVNHLYMERWEYEQECDECDGRGKTEQFVDKDGVHVFSEIESSDTIKIVCKRCKGSGKTSKTPYGVHKISRDAIKAELVAPTPPFGYPDKPIAVVDKVEERISKEEKRGLAAINMEIVQMVGEDQSGVAKAIDREDLNAFLSRYSRHVFELILPSMIEFTAYWRYSETVGDISSILPTISQPKDFNILTLNQLTQEYKDASNSNVSPNYLMHLEKELNDSKFANSEQERQLNNAVVMLQPFPGADLLTVRNLGVEEWEILKQLKIAELVRKAAEEDESFLSMPLKEQREIIDEMARELLETEELPLVQTAPGGDDDDLPVDEPVE